MIHELAELIARRNRKHAGLERAFELTKRKMESRKKNAAASKLNATTVDAASRSNISTMQLTTSNIAGGGPNASTQSINH